jgi:hypothetical protein
MDQNGNTIDGILIEQGVESSVPENNDFNSGAEWTKSACTVPAVTVTGPDEIDYQRLTITEDDTNAVHGITATCTRTNPGDTIFTAYAKKPTGGRDCLRVLIEAGANTSAFIVDLTDGSFGGIASAGSCYDFKDYFAYDIGNGWYFIQGVFPNNPTATYDISIQAATDFSTYSYLGDERNAVQVFLPSLIVTSTPIPSSPVLNESTATATRSSDGVVKYSTGSIFSSGNTTILFDVLFPEASEALGSTKPLLYFTDGGDTFNAIAVYLDTNRQMTVISFNIGGGGDAGSSTVASDICDGNIYRVKILALEDNFICSIKNLHTGTVTDGNLDTSCGVALGIDTLELNALNAVVGNFRLYPGLRDRWDI